MAFVAYPHIHLGEVASVVRIGVPCESLEFPLWKLYLKIAFAGFALALIAATLNCFYWHFRRLPVLDPGARPSGFHAFPPSPG
jgi:hypothetical protein